MPTTLSPDLLLPQLRRYFAQQDKIERVYLFGSVASGTSGADSDIDLLIRFRKGALPTLFDLITTKQELEDLTGKRIDLVQEGTAYAHVAGSMEETKVLVYG